MLMRYFYWQLLLLLVLLCSVHKSQVHIDTAKSYLGTIELTNNNDGVNVEMFLRYVGLSKGYPWCSAYVSYCLGSVDYILSPKISSAMARKFKTGNSISAMRVLEGTKIIPKGSVAGWEKGNTVFGHVGFVLEWQYNQGTTIEGNTSSGIVGSQSDGDGIYIRKRAIYPGNYFRITYFTPVIYNDVSYDLNIFMIEPRPLTTLETLKLLFLSLSDI